MCGLRQPARMRHGRNSRVCLAPAVRAARAGHRAAFASAKFPHAPMMAFLAIFPSKNLDFLMEDIAFEISPRINIMK
jgi:hypothetical protein